MPEEIKKITKETKFGLNPTPDDKKDFDYGLEHYNLSRRNLKL